MAEGKKSFILYVDLIHTISKLPDDKAGQLFKHLLKYVNDEKPETDDLLLQIAFEPIKQQLKRDLREWDAFREKQRENGKLGGRPHKTETQNNPNNPSLILETQKSLNANANATVNVNVKKTYNIEERKLLFADTLKPFIDTVSRVILKNFYNYWTEPNHTNTKMRFELERTWGLSRRISTWVKRDKTFTGTIQVTEEISPSKKFNPGRTEDEINKELLNKMNHKIL